MPEPPIFEIFGSGSSFRQIPAPAPTPTPILLLLLLFLLLLLYSYSYSTPVQRFTTVTDLRAKMDNSIPSSFLLSTIIYTIVSSKVVTVYIVKIYSRICKLFGVQGPTHRISIQQEVKGEGGGSSSPLLNLTDPCRILDGCWAGGLGQLFQYMRKYNAESPKQGSRRFNSIVKTKYIADLGIVYLCCQSTNQQSSLSCWYRPYSKDR